MESIEYGSVKVKSAKMIAAIQQARAAKPSDLIVIVGEASTGRKTFARFVQNEVFRSQATSVFTAHDWSVQSRSGVLVLTPDQWVELSSEIKKISFCLIELPTLAERREDLPQLADFFLQVLSLMNNKPQVKLTEKALEKILQYGWPGQFSEFEASLEAAFQCSQNGLIEPEALIMGPSTVDVGVPVGMKLEDLERKYILQTLYFVHQNRTRAAEILGISIRTLRNKLNQYRAEGYL